LIINGVDKLEKLYSLKFDEDVPPEVMEMVQSEDKMLDDMTSHIEKQKEVIAENGEEIKKKLENLIDEAVNEA